MKEWNWSSWEWSGFLFCLAQIILKQKRHVWLLSSTARQISRVYVACVQESHTHTAIEVLVIRLDVMAVRGQSPHREALTYSYQQTVFQRPRFGTTTNSKYVMAEQEKFEVNLTPVPKTLTSLDHKKFTCLLWPCSFLPVLKLVHLFMI